jgi:hypothetical protein
LGLDSCEVSADFASELERELNAAKADLAQRTAERDEARRIACLSEARYMNFARGFYPRDDDEARARNIAVRSGWNCFDAPHTNATDVPVRNGGEP